MFLNPEDLVLWADPDLLVINKPAGLPTLPDGYHKDAPHVKSVLEPLYGRLWIVHRLDKETSGVLVLARNAEAHRSLNTQFEQHTAHKVYHALVHGAPSWDERTVRLPLRANGDRRHRTVVDPRQGKEAITHLRVMERFEGWAAVEAVLETGRTHQIRAHLAALGLPLANDTLYGGKDNELPPPTGITRVALHAWKLAFSHPLDGQKMEVTADYPADFISALNRLRSLLS